MLEIKKARFPMDVSQVYVVERLQMDVNFEGSYHQLSQSEKLKLYFNAFLTAAVPFVNKFFGARAKQISTLNLCVICCDEKQIRALNKKYRNKNKPTDVLSFPVHENLRETKARGLAGEIVLGDIFICLPVAEKQAQDFKLTVEEEVVHLLIHGFLHLLGHDHEISIEEEEIMQEHETALLMKTADILRTLR
ncbi:MAG: rRNA maturation RNase YbeY [Bacteriovoracaceae bacterium]|nr:rRNA maturation RNase YbeY [Bacteriovoracaceae bacterium]